MPDQSLSLKQAVLALRLNGRIWIVSYLINVSQEEALGFLETLATDVIGRIMKAKMTLAKLSAQIG